ncbi:hypothetical protein [Anaeromyxobacter sp. PSR-1]|uniref:hypothetical protein n=1 Tax=Anaeromyxobacter sp. PSR-1 TaxID=1300915 RepID=UPI0005E86DCF|nr:hypothetical protein [Anaeromyxobacter sp. PSR-1]GAO01877.1 hypothetical protein PSR1_00738 [Anaeromyxobacter sp. PSR-1]
MTRSGARAAGAAALLALLLPACDDDEAVGGGCRGGTCGFVDHLYFSTYVCGGWGVGYSWRSLDHCVRQCEVAAAWGCAAGACAGECTVDHGTGAWLTCTPDNREARVVGSGCFLPTSGMDGETVPCDCR